MPKKAETKTAKPTTKPPPVGKSTMARPAKYPRHSVEKALRIPRAILEQNGGHASTVVQAAGYLGLTNPKGAFAVEIGSARKFGFLDSPEQGKIHPTELARRILRPKSPEDQLEAYRAAVLQAPDIADVYKHYRGENIPQDTFFKNTLVDTFGIPEADFADFKQIFLESLQAAKLTEEHGENTRILHISEPNSSLVGEEIRSSQEARCFRASQARRFLLCHATICATVRRVVR